MYLIGVTLVYGAPEADADRRDGLAHAEAGHALGMRRHYDRWLRLRPLRGFTATSQLASICWRCLCVLWNNALTRPSDGGKSMTRNVTRNLFE